MSLPALESRLDDLLPPVRLMERPKAELLAAAREWSDAVWAAAERQAVPAFSDADVRRGLALAAQPVFICGVHRSGTTFVRDLLDGHPALAVLPSEGTFFTSFSRLDRLAERAALAGFGREWLRRLMNPINQPPYWLLGRSTAERSPYVTFAVHLRAWWHIVDDSPRPGGGQWPMAALALAYAAHLGGGQVDSAASRWAEKTPVNERFIARLRGDFPGAKILHMVRHPVATLASRKQMELNATGCFRGYRQALRDLDLSYRVAAEEAAAGASASHLTVRYEDLVSNPRAEMARVAAFLGIAMTPVLLEPTVAGLPASSNSSFHHTAARGRIHSNPRRPSVLTDAELLRIHAALGDAASSLGYRLP